MDTDESGRVIPDFDEHDKAALFAVLIRTIRAQDQIEADQQLIKEANVRIVANNAAKARAVSLLTFFGFKAPEGENIWNLVRDAIGQELYDRGFAIARGRFPALLEHEGSLSSAVSEADVSEKADGTEHQTPVRTAILQYLKSMGAEGAKVGQVRRHLLDAYGMNLHEKTPGMTLYRLLKDGLARREGRTWFIDENAEKKANEAPAKPNIDTSWDASASDTAHTAQ